MTRALPVLHHGDGWVAVAKPAGLLVHRTAMAGDERDAALQRVRDQLGVRVHPVHRLDRPVSGVLLFALDPERARALAEALSTARKRYLALVRGAFAGPEVVVDRALRDENGVMREARSVVRPLAASADPRCALVEVRPDTGRFHQVRRHLRGLDHPILGDATHGDTRANRAFRERTGLPRLALHCLELAIEAPEGATRIVCPVPGDLRAVLEALPLWADAVTTVPELQLPPLDHPG